MRRVTTVSHSTASKQKRLEVKSGSRVEQTRFSAAKGRDHLIRRRKPQHRSQRSVLECSPAGRTSRTFGSSWCDWGSSQMAASGSIARSPLFTHRGLSQPLSQIQVLRSPFGFCPSTAAPPCAFTIHVLTATTAGGLRTPAPAQGDASETVSLAAQRPYSPDALVKPSR